MRTPRNGTGGAARPRPACRPAPPSGRRHGGTGPAGLASQTTCSVAERRVVLHRWGRPGTNAGGVGVALGVAAYLAGPWFAAAAGWLAGFATTLDVQAAVAFRRLLGLGS